MTTDTVCPDENTLARVAEGRFGSLSPALESHLDVCTTCRRAIAAAASSTTLPTAAPRAIELHPGMRVGRYEIEHELGRGGMGVVSMARDLTLDRRVAVKLLHARRDPEAQARLLREAQVMAKLAHPNVVPVFELGEWQGELYLVMELVNGMTLQTWLTSAPHARREVLAKFIAAGRGLAAAHACGVIHRDFKPANVLVGLDGRARVTDFGLSRPGPALEVPPLASPLVTREGALVGTVVYMAPEQLDGQAATERSDQFAFCVSLVEALAGERPFDGETWSELAVSHSKPPRLSRVPRSLRSVLRKGLSIDPAQRYTSLTALLDALERSQRPGWASVGGVGVAALLATAVMVGRPAPTPATSLVPVAASESPSAMVQVLVATRDLNEGDVISIDALTLDTLPARSVSASFVKPDGLPYILATTVTAPMLKGDALLWSHLSGKGPAVIDVSRFLVESPLDRDELPPDLIDPGPVPHAIVRTLAVAREQFATCSAMSLVHGYASLQWTVDDDGKVRAVSVTPGRSAGADGIAACFAREVKSLSFPTDQSATVRYLFRY